MKLQLAYCVLASRNLLWGIRRGFQKDLKLLNQKKQIKNIIFVKSFSTTNVNNATQLEQMHNNQENKTVDNFLRDNPAYLKTLYSPIIINTTTKIPESKELFIESSNQITSKKLHPIVQKLIQSAMSNETNSHPITSDINKALIEEVLLNIKSLQDEDLLTVLYCLRFFAPCSSAKDPDYFRIWSTFDKECISRMSAWNLDFLFTVADLWYGIFLSRLSEFHWKLIQKCFRKCDKLTKEQFIRFMFCLNLVRGIPPYINTYDLEHYLTNLIEYDNKLSAQEVAIISMAFFKTETRLHNPLVVEKLLNIFIVDAAKTDSVSVAAVAKFARFCSSTKIKDALIRFQNAFLLEIDRLSVTACTHITLVGTNTQAPSMTLINAVVKKIENNLKTTRLKELERISLVMTMFNADCDRLGELIANELKTPERAEEIRLYGRCLPAILHYLSIREIFPKDLISIALSEEFRKTYYGNKRETYQRELLCLDFCAQLEISDYTGNRLDNQTREKLTKKNIIISKNSHKVSETDSLIRRVIQTMENACGGSEFVYGCKILPHHHSIEIVYCTNDDGAVVKIPQEYRQMKDYEIKFIPETSQNIKYNAIFVCSQRNTVIGSDNKLLEQGQVILQVRQIKKMGYHVNMVFPSSMEETINNLIKRN